MDLQNSYAQRISSGFLNEYEAFQYHEYSAGPESSLRLQIHPIGTWELRYYGCDYSLDAGITWHPWPGRFPPRCNLDNVAKHIFLILEGSHHANQ